jgi:hypothetical protein
MGLRKRLKPRVHLGEQDENTNWSLRDNVSYYGDQAKAAPAAAREVAKLPRTWMAGIREMVADMRDDTPALPPDDPARAPIEGVTLEECAAVTAELAKRRVDPNDHAARDAVAVEHGIAPGNWERAALGWRERQVADPRVAQAFGAAVRSGMHG